MLDTVIRDGSVVDGTGRPARLADIGIKDGRIVSVGQVDDLASSVIDAGGLLVCPGFIDLHTHYDPHVMWDPGVTPSSLHGVTSIVGGNCGFTLAPITVDAAAYVAPMLARVEGMPIESLQECLDFGWDSFGSWLARLDGRVAVNSGFLVGHSTIRRVVMGQAAVGRTATPDELGRMVRLVHESLEQGALGFSSSHGPAHRDHLGDPVPSRWADRNELVTLSAAVADHDGTTLEFIPSSTRQFTDDDIATMTAMSAAANRPLNWNLLTVFGGDGEPERIEARLAASDWAATSGAMVRALTLPMAPQVRLNFLTGFSYDAIPRWSEVLFKLAPDERIKALRDTAIRQQLRDGADLYQTAPGGLGFALIDWPNCTICDVASPQNASLIGQRVADIAAQRGVDAFDALLDIVGDDNLLTGIELPIDDYDELWRHRLALWRDPRTILGGSDAGAHLDMLRTFSMHTTFLSEAVRRRQLLTMEEAIWHVTDVPARFYGLKRRGRITEGWWADLVVFDPVNIGPGTIEFCADLPAGGRRLYSKPTGIECTVVNGVVTSRNGELTGDTPGTVLRSGADTATVSPQ